MTIEEILFLEADDSCAYCGLRQKVNLSIHHIDDDKTNNEYDNLIVLCHCCHHRVTNNKGISKEDIKKRKKRLIYKTLTQYGINAIKIAYRKKDKIVAMPFLLFHLVDMGYLKQKGELLWQGTMDHLVYFEITNEGRALYEKWLK